MKLFSTEQISKYHPDKYADQISDALLTEYLKLDPNAHCGIETLVKDDAVVLAGEINSTVNSVKFDLDHEDVVSRVGKKLGYGPWNIIDLINTQSPEINAAVGQAEGAGDQGMMFGYATDETDSFLPFGFDLANKIIKKIEYDVEKNPKSPLVGDAKTQVTVDLETNTVHEILVSACHKSGPDLPQIQDYIFDLLYGIAHPKKWTINPAGIWTIGGPAADCGLTGRKIVCDQYGGYCAVGGGAFSGKDPSKVDRSASYMARKIAVDMVKNYGGQCRVQLAYAIGVAEPVSVSGIVTKHPGSEIGYDVTKEIRANYDLTPAGIIKTLDLLNKDYEKIAEGCHFRKGIWK